MNHADHVRLLKRGVNGPGVWADFGSGNGSFTLALAELISPSGEIHSVDRDGQALVRQRRSVTVRFPELSLTTYEADFTEPLELPQLDGLVAANALHYLPRKDETVRLLRDYLRPGGHFLVVEYDTDRGNRWVPYPFSYNQWRIIASRCGLVNTELLDSAPSSFLGSFYSALSRTSLGRQLGK